MSLYYMHDLTPFSPIEEIETLLAEMRADPEPDNSLREQIADVERMLEDARSVDTA